MILKNTVCRMQEIFSSRLCFTTSDTQLSLLQGGAVGAFTSPLFHRGNILFYKFSYFPSFQFQPNLGAVCRCHNNKVPAGHICMQIALVLGPIFLPLTTVPLPLHSVPPLWEFPDSRRRRFSLCSGEVGPSRMSSLTSATEAQV